MTVDVRSATGSASSGGPGRAGRRFGYLVGIAVNAVLLWVVNRLLHWEWPPFLTDEFADALPWVRASLWAAILGYAVRLVFDPKWFRHLVEAATTVVSLAALVVLIRVHPFSFADDGPPYDLLVRVVLVIGIVGSVIGIITNVAKALRANE